MMLALLIALAVLTLFFVVGAAAVGARSRGSVPDRRFDPER